MNFAEYQAIDAINFSSLKMMRESPLHYWSAVNTPKAPTPALVLGNAAHCAILEPKRFVQDYAIEPIEPDFGDCRNRANKAARDEWREQMAELTAGKIVLAKTDYNRVQAMHDAVHANPHASELLARGEAEVTLQWVDRRTQLACKGRIDWLMHDSIVGLKTTKSNNFRSFQRSVEDYGYLLQWAFYQVGLALDPKFKRRKVDLYEICVESVAPHDVVVYRIPQELIDDAIDENTELLMRVAECKKSGIWPGRAPGIVEFHRAKWAVREQEEEIDLEGCAA